METFGTPTAAPSQTIAQTPDVLRQQIAQQQNYLQQHAEADRSMKAQIKSEIAVLEEKLSIIRSEQWKSTAPWLAGGFILGLLGAAALKGGK